jgi:Tfp pilus assembly protein PilV
MNWQMLGALGEFFGALGVIATLGYLARQVRESTAASRQAEQQHIWEQNTQFLSQLATRLRTVTAVGKGDGWG